MVLRKFVWAGRCRRVALVVSRRVFRVIRLMICVGRGYLGRLLIGRERTAELCMVVGLVWWSFVFVRGFGY